MAVVCEEALIDHLQRRLIVKYGHLPPAEVARAVEEAQQRFAGSPVRNFVPLLVERRADESLSAQSA